MQTIDDIWNKFATQDELAQAYIQQGALFDELDIIIEDFFAAYERFKNLIIVDGQLIKNKIITKERIFLNNDR